MTEDEVAYLLLSILDGDDDAFEELDVARTSSFDSVGLLTMNKGVVLTLGDGSEYQLTVVRSRSPHD